MNEIDPGLKDFFTHWFAGFSRGMETLDGAAREKLLHQCGRACAQSYTVQIFRQARADSADLDAFLYNLSRSLPGAGYERLGANVIRATYAQCGCDLVRLGLVRSPQLCACSAANLRENLEQALGTPVSVTIESSILRGGSQCVLLATLEADGSL